MDTVHKEWLYATSQLGSNTALVDIKARNYFYKGTSASKLKCIVKINHYRKQNVNINRGLVEDKCPRYTENEDQHHIIRYKAISEQRREFLIELHDKLQEENRDGTFKNKILRILHDIV